jgi:hypothetical protein
MDSKIQLPGDTKISSPEVHDLDPKQSANGLFNFMKEFSYLKKILLNKAIIPRYNEENIKYISIEGFDRIAFPMVCFCDIHLNRLVHHINFYGQYGIGLTKKWGILQGIQPIQYINDLSDLNNDFSEVFSLALHNLSQNISEEQLEKYNNFLLTNLLFMKPITGEMVRNNETKERNFHDEKEWRYVPNFNNAKTELPQIVPQEQLNRKAYDIYSVGLAKHKELWLKFKYADIKYLIVSTDDDRKELIDFIKNDLEADNIDRDILLTRILVYNEIKEDW